MVHFKRAIILLALLGLPASADDYELYKKGRLHWYENEWSQAAEAFKKLIEQYPTSPRRCRSENYLGYCYSKMGNLRQAFDILSGLIKEGKCKSETLIDAKSERLRIAHRLVSDDPSMLGILKDGLKDSSRELRMLAGILLSELGDASGLDVFFETVENETDQELRDTAGRHILKLGSAKDKQRLRELMDAHKKASAGMASKMVRLVIRDKNNSAEQTKINVPIGLISVVLNTISQEHRKLIKEESGIDLNNLNLDLTDLPPGTVLFQVVDGSGKEIKLTLE